LKPVLRPLVFLNVLAALVFIFPVAVWFAMESSTSGTPRFDLTSSKPIERSSEPLHAIKDIEKLRQRASALEQTLEFERRTREDDSLFTRRLGGWLGALLLIAGAGFLVNAGFLTWVVRRQAAQP
jgi:hypothetical protein